MNIFYAPPAQIQGHLIELRGQEAIHASKALRYSRGDEITVVDGVGNWYEGQVQHIDKKSVRIAVYAEQTKTVLQPDIILGMGIIKKRDRLEFAVEKAVELGVKEIALFRSRHTVKQNVRLDRLQNTIISAMKQSLRAWRPEVKLYAGLDEVMDAYQNTTLLVAHETEKQLLTNADIAETENTLLLVGPEGGFSEAEIDKLAGEGATIISLGNSRLRTETAALTIINHYNYWLRSK